jgi:micrococcal nuclease
VARKVLGAVIALGVLVAIAVFLFYVQTSSKPSVGRDTPLIDGTCRGNADCITGSVTRVIDGDTLDIDGTRIRLALVNSPETGENGYDEARRFTLELCPVGSQAVADEDDGQPEGSFGRVIAKVTCDGGKVVNEELLQANMAVLVNNFCEVSEFRNEGWARSYGC